MLPITPVLPDLLDALARRGVAVLEAPPGAGKTTRVPLALLDAGWLGGRAILMLEPRRLAARAAAGHMARLLGEQVGETVGYRVRRDTRVGPRTRIEVVTEGVLTRMLHSDPVLEHVGIVIFDEFHERSLHADLGLALTLQTRALLRDDLRVLVMSATLDGNAVADLLGDGAPAPVVIAHGREFPVDTRYVPARLPQRLDAHVVSVVRHALAGDEGDILVFLPGAGEIARVERMLLEGTLPPRTCVAPLHGSLDQAAQDRATAPGRPGERRIVLATTVAQTSLTIEGVRIVVDCGLVRVPRFAPRTGMTHLETVRVSRASADQRRGRAGRTAPGICYRLWPALDDAGLVAFDRPEILEADLAPLGLELAAAGIGDAGVLRWLDQPPPAALAQARELLTQLDALGADGRITPHGQAMTQVGAHPRVAHMLLRAGVHDAATQAVACDLAALIGQRDVLRYERTDGAAADVDIRLRLETMRSARSGAPRQQVDGAAIDHGALRHALEESAQWRRMLGLPAAVDGVDVDAAGMLIALAYPERVAQRRVVGGRPTTRFLMRNGAGAELTGAQSLGDAAYLAIAELGGVMTQPRIFSAAPLAAEDLETALRSSVQREQVIEWDSARRCVQARERTRIGAIVLRDGPLRQPDPDAVVASLLSGIRRDGLQVLPWSAAAVALRERLAFAHAVDSSWPDVSAPALTASLEAWLAPGVRGVPGRTSIDEIDMEAALLSLLAWPQRQALDRFAPTHVEVPSGSRIRIDYSTASAPVLAVRLQEVFGLHETPRIANGQVSLTMHLLSPAQRPVQVTRDLAGFWRSGYFEVKKELKGRYPRHYWPDDPLVAEPRRGIRR